MSRINPQRLLILAACMASLCLLAGCCCAADAPESDLRKIGGRMYSGTMDGRRGLLFFAAGDTSLTLVYDPARCGLHAAWKGPAVGPARSQDGSYAPQGPLFHKQKAARLWTVRNGQDTLSAAVGYLGFKEDSTGFAVFKYAIGLPGGDTIHVEEEPSLDDHYGDIALRRDFHFRGIPPGHTVSVLVGGEAGGFPERLFHSAGGGVLTREPQGLESLSATEDGISTVDLLWEGSAGP